MKMKPTYSSILIIAVLFVSLIISKSAQAGFFYTETLIGSPHWWEDTSSDTWVYFGGCEDIQNKACILDPDSSSSLIIGDYGVKQGVYALSVANDYHIHGRLVLKYNYQFLSEESSDQSHDVGYVKLKDVETNEVYYLQTLTAADETDDWQSVRLLLSNNLVNRPLQLVFEVENDGENLSTLGIQSSYVSLKHFSEPIIRGTVYERVAGKEIPVDGATIKLQNHSRTKTYATTETRVQSDTSDSYTFWPVSRKKKLTIIALYQGEEKSVMVSKMKYGDFSADVDFIFD